MDSGADASQLDAAPDTSGDARVPPPVPSLHEGEWVKAWGTSGGEGRAVATDAAGNVYVAGSIAGAADFGGGPFTSMDGLDVVVASFTPDGTYRWERHFPGTGSQRVVAMDLLGDRLAVVGTLQGTSTFGAVTHTVTGGSIEDAFLLILDTNGNVQSFEPIGGPGSDEPRSVAFDDSGGIYVTISFNETFDFHGTRLDMGFVGSSFVASFDASSGAFRDLHTFLYLFDAPYVAPTPGALRFAGGYNARPSFGGEIIESEGERDVYAFSLGRTYGFGWETVGHGVDDAAPTALAVDNQARSWIAGEFRGDLAFGALSLSAGAIALDSFLVRLGEDGTADLAVLVGGSGGQYAGPLVIDTMHSAFITGAFSDEIVIGTETAIGRGAQDIFVASLDEELGLRWLRSFGGVGTSQSRGWDIALGASGDVFVVGTFGEDVDFGGTVVHNDHDGGWFLLRLQD